MSDMRRLANKNNSSSSLWGGSERESGQPKERAQLQPKHKLPHQCARVLSLSTTLFITHCTLCFCMAAGV